MKLSKVMKYEIVKPADENTWETLGKALHSAQYENSKVANKAIQILWDYNNFSISYKQKYGRYYDIKKDRPENTYESIDGYIRNELKSIGCKMNSNGLDAIIRMVLKKWKSDLKDVVNGKRSISNFKNDIPIELHNKQIELIKENNNYYFIIKLVSKEYSKELGMKDCSFKLLVKAHDGTQRNILEKCLSGQYKIGMSKVTRLKKDKVKWMINLTYSFEKEEEHNLNKNNIMGVDMGVVYPAYMAVNNSLSRDKIDGGEIEKFRKGVETRRISLLRQGKYCGDGRIGHGRKTRIKPIEVLSERISNFRSTCNHKYSKFIVDFAVKNDCGVIQMEDLSGVSKNNTFLKNWSYYDLQQKIKYKALESGIEVKLIDPKYTSQRCSKCGFIHKENRQEQASFKCLDCGFETNADYNAAKNIATDDIENIIREQLKKQDREYKHNLKMIV